MASVLSKSISSRKNPVNHKWIRCTYFVSCRMVCQLFFYLWQKTSIMKWYLIVDLDYVTSGQGFWILAILSVCHSFSFTLSCIAYYAAPQLIYLLIFMWPVEVCFHIHESARLPPGFRCYNFLFSGKLLILPICFSSSIHALVLRANICPLIPTEKRGLWSLGAISWDGAHWHCAKKGLYSESGMQLSYEMMLSNFMMSVLYTIVISSLLGHKYAVRCGVDSCIFARFL